MYEILKDFQVLTTGFLAIVAASIGFIGVWYAQRKTLENAERERKHKEALQDAQRRRDENDAIRTLVGALAGELGAIHHRILTTHESMSRLIDHFSATGNGLSNIPGKKIISTINTQIFDMCLDKIGMLPPPLSVSVVTLYSNIKVLETIPVIEEKISTVDLLLAYRAAMRILTTLSAEIADTVLRLYAVRLKKHDPGEGKGEEYWRSHFPEEFKEIPLASDIFDRPRPQPPCGDVSGLA